VLFLFSAVLRRLVAPDIIENLLHWKGHVSGFISSFDKKLTGTDFKTPIQV
jgi:hypothetical protein